MNHYQVIIVGGGQAGLSVSYCLKKENINHLILDRGQIGDSWAKRRWDSFCLVTPNWQCRLPGFDYNGNDPKGFMLKDEIVDYVKRYASSFNPPYKGGVEVFKVYKKEAEVIFSIETSIGNFTATKVIIAAGAYHIPNVLSISKGFDNDINQIHSVDYKNPEQLTEGATLVIGSGQSGAQIAEDLHIAGKEVYLSVGTAPRAPRTYRGKDAVEWLEDMGYYDQPIESHPDPEEARHKTNHYLTGRDGGRDIDLRKLAIEGIQLRGQLSHVENGIINFNNDLKENLDAADATYTRIQKNIDAYIDNNNIKAPAPTRYEPLWEPNTENKQHIDYKKEGIKNIIWCTGFRVDYNWIEFPHIYDQKGFPMYKRGITEEPGLYFIGLPWLHTWGSGRFSHVGQDAIYISNHIIDEFENELMVTCLTKNS
ncbi:MSMEG_0569 family flavin-dependent oxidoreductase [Aquimarina sp. RZ0]|uniref:MSMEG_0569 family flavin-dependent oxidoreductase n=1 Tax=Aquimarina sp. RZ0 TaxID=2607730 RepID=UPI0011F15FCE|nr:MSMEG_0569 family flavin-dependent oxidoreductase [Aquimarina sp. RZ0]KAA1243128.1 MSMEG_0569 family flavin-dependent oxidoreductase [Aquimarina sp. RZ0]